MPNIFLTVFSQRFNLLLDLIEVVYGFTRLDFADPGQRLRKKVTFINLILQNLAPPFQSGGFNIIRANHEAD
jgi:hypothetical protein